MKSMNRFSDTSIDSGRSNYVTSINREHLLDEMGASFFSSKFVENEKEVSLEIFKERIVY